MKTTFLLINIISLLTACAGAPKKADDDGAIKATYKEKIHTVRWNQLKVQVACPKENGFEKEAWQKQVEYAKACLQSKDYAQLDKVANNLSINASSTPWGPYFLSLSASARHNMPRAQWMLDLALKKAPREGLLHYELARLDWDLGLDAAAVKEMKLAADLNETLFDAHLVVGELALERGDNSEARRYLENALSLDANHLDALLSRATLDLRANDFGSAEQFLNRAVTNHPRSSKARLALAEVQEQHLKKNVEALSSYKQIKALSNDRQLDGSIPSNLDARIQALEKTLSQAAPSKDGTRQPSSKTTEQR